MACPRTGVDFSDTPGFETLFTVGQKLSVVSEVELEPLLCRLVELTPVVFILTADVGSILVDAAAAIRLQVFAASLEHEVPAALILVELHPLVGDLPQQVLEVRLGARCNTQRLGGVGAADGAGAAAALVIDRDVHESAVAVTGRGGFPASAAALLLWGIIAG